jgi:cellulose synthase/poly-beta-1,6-N-acetylglucosamine synthase-like glycosyltransferase
MTESERIIAIVFWICAGLVVYAYAGYPLLILALSRVFGRRGSAPSVVSDDGLPRVSLLIAAYNEEAVIGERLRNALELDYPPEKLEILVGSDGSRDRTAAIVREFASQDVRLLDFAQTRVRSC